MSQSSTLSVGLDVHTESIAVASVADDHHAEVVSLGTSGTRHCDLDRLIRRLPSKSSPLVFVYAAGPCGDGLSRSLTHKGQVCWVVAPALLPQQSGERVKTHRRDAITRTRRLRSAALTPVSVPTVADAAMRDLCRAREDALRARKTATFRLTACWLRHAIRSGGRATWGPAHLRWLSAVVCPTPAQPSVFQAEVRAVTEQTARLQRLDQALQEHVERWRLQPVVEALQGLRGVPCTVALTRVADLGDLTPLDHPSQLRRDRGLLPSAYASGDRRRQGGLTKTGTTHARRALIEGAWASRDPAKVSRPLQGRLEQLPNPMQALSGKAHVRLCTRVRRRMARGKHPNHVVVAMARALVGFLWAMAQQVPVTL